MVNCVVCDRQTEDRVELGSISGVFPVCGGLCRQLFMQNIMLYLAARRFHGALYRGSPGDEDALSLPCPAAAGFTGGMGRDV
jgi:hypothetical protein